ncbi:MAG: hypothetical protein JNK30_18385 [Phenylobacterium sp.]|uniref:hypothetical protein n=1 Tax=Phenylobacterium sp. TaxID=1871053 RepID=UPI001A5F6878|nr:hypothetical protein [Phenylobacterium sp.]MBL8773358.1 hypothetical protein [Phenylobacterium sp.]
MTARNRLALGGAKHLGPMWPGAARHVQGESLKAVGLSCWQVSNPRLPAPIAGAAFESRPARTIAMNAHTPDLHERHGRQVALDACPVAAIARRFAHLEDEDAKIQNTFGRPDQQRMKDEMLSQELLDCADQLGQQAEWLEACTLEGVYFQALQLGRVAREIVDEATQDPSDGFHVARLSRRFNRLQHLVLDGLERLGGFDGADYGKRHLTLSMPQFREVLEHLRA